MSQSLVIVESPAKAKTINKYLGKDYKVEASFGHIMDLPKRDIGVELKNRTFEPTLIVTPDKEKIVRQLRKLAEKADFVYLAPDPDREGEAIAAHLARQLLPVVKDGRKIRRVTFNEITQKAVRAAFEHARDVDENLVDAQQTRRVLDRIVGYQISPLLWDKVRRGTFRGTRADGGGAADRGARAGDPGVQAGRVLDHRRSGGPGAGWAGVHSAVYRHRRREGRGADGERAGPAGSEVGAMRFWGRWRMHAGACGTWSGRSGAEARLRRSRPASCSRMPRGSWASA